MVTGQALLVLLDAGDGGAQADGHAAVAQLVDEVVDHLAVDEIQHRGAGLDQGHRHVHGREDGRVFDADHAGADHRQAAGHRGVGDQAVAVEDVGVVERDVAGAIGGRAHGDQDALAAHDLLVAIGLGHGQAMGVDEAGLAGQGAHAVALELVLQHLDLVVQGLVQAHGEVGAADVLLDPVGAAVEAALAPAGQVQRRLAQGLGRDGAGVHRHPADAAAVLDHQHRLAQLGRLHRGPAARRPRADDDEIVAIHLDAPWSHSRTLGQA